MAATVSTSVWNKPGAWALEAEEHEEELKREIQQSSQTLIPEPEFPSLSTAVTVKPSKKKNKPQKTLSLAEFSSYGGTKPAEPGRLTPDEMLLLPTAPRQRSADELLDRGPRGFRNYGGGDRDRDRERERPRDRERDMGPSRADEVDDWSKGKKFSGGDRREKVSFFGSSRADEVDNWAAGKSFNPAPLDPPRRERRGGFGGEGGADGENWLRRKEESEAWGRRESGNGVAARPRLNLQPRTLPVVPIEVKSEEVEREEVRKVVVEVVRVKGANPFGEARPREEVLKEKGQDWKEIDEKLEAVKLKEKEAAAVVVSEKDGERFGGGGGGGRRRGFGLGRGGEAEERSVRTWRKPESDASVSPPPGGDANADADGSVAPPSRFD